MLSRLQVPALLLVIGCGSLPQAVAAQETKPDDHCVVCAKLLEGGVHVGADPLILDADPASGKGKSPDADARDALRNYLQDKLGDSFIVSIEHPLEVEKQKPETPEQHKDAKRGDQKRIDVCVHRKESNELVAVLEIELSKAFKGDGSSERPFQLIESTPRDFAPQWIQYAALARWRGIPIHFVVPYDPDGKRLKAAEQFLSDHAAHETFNPAAWSWDKK